MDVITVVHISYMYFSKVAFLESIFFIDLCLFVFIFFFAKASQLHGRLSLLASLVFEHNLSIKLNFQVNSALRSFSISLGSYYL